MKRASGPGVAIAFAISIALIAALPSPAQARAMADDHRPSALAMFGDALIVRPVMAVGTLVGAVVYTVTLPFTALGGNADEAAETLVKTPARTTFVRCLGCTPQQHRRMLAHQRAEEQLRAEQATSAETTKPDSNG